VSRRNIWDTSATPSGIKREWYVCMYAQVLKDTYFGLDNWCECRNLLLYYKRCALASHGCNADTKQFLWHIMHVLYIYIFLLNHSISSRNQHQNPLDCFKDQSMHRDGQWEMTLFFILCYDYDDNVWKRGWNIRSDIKYIALHWISTKY
jgi:hypothetical protein